MKTTMNIFVAYAVLMVTGLIGSVSVSADFWAEAEANREQCISYCDGAYSKWTYSHAACEGECWKQFHRDTGQGSGADASEWITFPPKDEEPVMTAWSEPRNPRHSQYCHYECAPHETEQGYNACVDRCHSQASVEGTQVAQPTGHGGFLGGGGGGSNQQATAGQRSCFSRCNVHTTESGYNACMDQCKPQASVQRTQIATAECQFQCGDEHINEDDYGACVNNCNASASVERTQIAGFGNRDDRRYTCDDQGRNCKEGKRASAQRTQIALNEEGQQRLGCVAKCGAMAPTTALYQQCVARCDSRVGSAEDVLRNPAGQTTQIADGGYGSDGTAYGEDGTKLGYGGSCVSRCNAHTTESGYKACMNRCNGSASVQRTQIADIRIGDPQPTCGTDVWSCFHGGDDSPDVRNVDVGIFGVFADVRATTR